jgi:hypothetical protein
LSKLKSFVTNVLWLFYSSISLLLTHFQLPFSLPSDVILHHTIISTFLFSASAISNIQIVSIIILEHASLYYASLSRPTLDQALDRAYAQYMASNTHNAVIQQFSASSQTYSVLQLTDFILKYRLK